MSSDEVEIRFKTQGERLSILDAYCQATGKCRTEVMVGLLEKVVGGSGSCGKYGAQRHQAQSIKSGVDSE